MESNMEDVNYEAPINTSKELVLQIKRASALVYQLRRMSLRTDIPLEDLEKVSRELTYLEIDIIRLSEHITVKLAKEVSDVGPKQRSFKRTA